MKPERVSEISLEFQPSNTITRFLFYFSSFFPLPTLNIIFLFKKIVKQVFKITWKLSSRQRKAPNDPSPPFKENEKGGEEGSKVWWPMEGSKTWWPMEGERGTPFHLFHFPPNNLYPNLQFFLLTLQFYFTMVLSRYSRLPFFFFDL
jgi:hypothetical protein